MPLVLMAALSGCAEPRGRATGQVTYEGEPVAKGAISFMPADGNGSAEGGTIENGKYVVENLPPGPKRVQITAVKDVPFARSSAEMAEMAAKNKSKGDASGLIDPADIIPPDALGTTPSTKSKPASRRWTFI